MTRLAWTENPGRSFTLYTPELEIHHAGPIVCHALGARPLALGARILETFDLEGLMAREAAGVEGPPIWLNGPFRIAVEVDR